MTSMSETAIIMLAAGQSRRFGDENKLLCPIDNLPMITKSVNTAIDSGAGEIIVVTGHNSSAIEAAIDNPKIRIAHNATPDAGMGTSLAAGANAIRSLPNAVMVMLGDMPLLQTGTLQKLVSNFDPNKGHDIVVPIHEGRRGHPVLFGAKYMPQLCALSGDTGARSILFNHPERVRAVKTNDPGTLYDIDTEEDLNTAPATD